ncbi:NAD(P)H-dependent flavin oxidoreductase [Cohnella sp. JJ-181]|uniref:NAD(P)H-dependent flavin oxidoreductase n=1 Tax=Cohnella rhizoplanae TaxID=2974897 RepID=UPI0022FF5AB9|nr:nitronate monooxygenase [Cohnella sp. JJ-181]CAI6059809.1 Nitronate monooxygenase [Cohnella sp. JJ-181]
MENAFTRRLGISCPILQAPMAGGPATPELAAAVSNAGGLGSLGAGYWTPEQIRDAIREVRRRTDRPFGVNLFVPERTDTADEAVAAMNAHLNHYRARLGIGPAPFTPAHAPSFEAQLQVLLEEGVPVFSFTFGIPPADAIQAMKRRGTFIVGTATTVEEGIRLEAAGVDAVAAQGSEAGGHRGTFLGDAGDALIGTLALVPQLADRVSVPVIASGGIMDGRGLAASLALGASAVQMGTAFLASPESGAPAAHKRMVLSSGEDATAITHVYSGKAARGIRTEFMQDMQAYPGTIPGYPIQNALTRDIRQAAAQADDPSLMSLWAGQGLRLATAQAAADIVRRTVAEAQAAIGNLSKLAGQG